MRFCDVTKGEIKKDIKTHNTKMKREEIMASTKVGDRVSDDPRDNTYMTYMTLNSSRLWMRVRARMMKGIKMNHKSSHLDNLSCSFCNGPMEESQEHLEEECPGCDFERRNLKMHTLRGRQLFWRRMKAKIEEKSKKKKGVGIAAVAGVGRVNGEDRVVQQLVDRSISSTLTQNHV